MPAPKLTDLQLRNLHPDPTGARRLHLFADGFGVRVSPTGSKTLLYRYQHQGRKRYLTLGTYGPDGAGMSLKQALAAHSKARAAVLRGEDPAGAKQTARATAARAPTVQKLVDEFASQVLAVQPSGAETKRQIEKDILPRLGAKTPLAALKRRDAVEVVDAVRARGPRIGNAAATNLVRLGNFAVERGLLDANPFAGLKKTRLEPKTRVLADWELGRLMARLPHVDVHPRTALALLFVLVTGQRPGEVAGMAKSEVTDTLWTIPAARYKTATLHKVPLTGLALAVLEEAREHGDKKSDYVFPSPADPSRPIDRHSMSRAVLRKLGTADLDAPGLGTLALAPFTPHDLRRTCRTGMAALGVPDAVAEKVIGHRLDGMLAVYNVHDYLDERRDALNRWADHLMALTAGPQQAL